MEVIEVAGYTRDEKLIIARDFLVPKQLSAHGLTDEQLEFTSAGIGALIDHYTQEAGVRELERQIGAMCRATAVRLADGLDVLDVATPEHVEETLGVHKFRREDREEALRPGVATGLSSTGSGGRLMLIEASKMPGKGKIVLTGNMKNIMQESAATAVSYVRAKSRELCLDPEWLRDIDLHLHIPHHGVPRDGASAGLAMFAAVASLMLDHPLRSEVAMLGEISLRGRVLEVRDITPKLLAAHRAGIRTVLLPERNRPDLDEVPAHLKDELDIRMVSKVTEVLPLVLAPPHEEPREHAMASP
jgi:ATP-dependent Lon protease